MASKWVFLISTVVLFTSQFVIVAPSEVHNLPIQIQNKTVIEGSSVVLCCSMSNAAENILWFFDGIKVEYLGDVFKKTKDSEKNNYCLEINSVSLKEEGEYTCFSGVQDLRKKICVATLTVIVPPKPPVISGGKKFVTVFEGRSVDIECVSELGKPPAQIMWKDGDGKDITQNITNFITEVGYTGTYTVKSILKFVPQKYYNNTILKCLANNEALNASATLKIQVRNVPKFNRNTSSDARFPGQVSGSENSKVKFSGNESSMNNGKDPLIKLKTVMTVLVVIVLYCFLPSF